MNKIGIIHIVRLMLCSMLFLGLYATNAQSLRKPTPQFSAPCASAGFNSFFVNFKWDAPLVNSGNSFILELSDRTGDFSNPTQLSTVTDRNTILDFDFQFSFPTNTAGNNYRVRVRSTSPALTSPASDAFPAYFQNVTQSLILNSFAGTIEVCDGSSVTLSVDNFASEPSYRWYKNMNPTPIPGETGPTLEVTQQGFYFVEVDYGNFCSGSTASNEIEVILSSPQGIAINGAANVELCPGFSYQLTANIDDTGLIYRWLKDGNLINTPGYVPSVSVDTTDPAGTYTLEIETTSGGCVETSAPVIITVPDINVTISQPSNVLLLPSDTVTMEVTTTADSPAFAWFRDGSLLASETTNTLNVTSPGVYRARVTQGTGCAIEEFTNEVTVEFPQGFNITIAPESTYTECANISTALSITQIEAITSTNRIDVTTQLLDRFSYQWLKESLPLSGETANTLPVPDVSMNGVYTLEASLGAFDVVSNNFDVKLRLDQTVNINSDGLVSCDGASNITITSDVTDASYSYAWFKDNTLLAAETTPILSTNLTGTYRLGVTAFGCTNFSNEIIINPFEESIVTVDASETIVIPEGSLRIVTAAGADNYTWFNEESIEISNSASVTLSEEGQYVLRANVGTCEVIKMFTVQYQDSFAVPNVISPNSDGINDLWVIPNRYAFNSEVEVFIYGPNGENILNTVAYQNNWPESNLSYSTSKPVFYYKIVRGREILKQGTITLIR